MATVLVAGAGGYIGVPLYQRLLKSGHSVVALDRYFFGKDRVKSISSDPCETVRVEDIPNEDAKMLANVDAVYDLAGLSNDASAEISAELTRSINCEGGIHLARTAKEAGVRRYIYSSSASVYGHGVHQHLTECDECRPQTFYAESKLRVEEALSKLADPGFEVVIFRSATVFGLAPRMRFDLAINIMTLRAWTERIIYIMGGGEQWRPLVHVNDLVRVFLLGLEADAKVVAGEIFNVGGDSMNYQIKQLAQFVLDVIPNVTVHQIPDDADKRTYNVSFAKIKERLSFEPTIRAHEGIVEIKQALERGVISGQDPTFFTLPWYRSLIEWERRIKELTLHDRIL